MAKRSKPSMPKQHLMSLLEFLVVQVDKFEVENSTFDIKDLEVAGKKIKRVEVKLDIIRS